MEGLVKGFDLSFWLLLCLAQLAVLCVAGIDWVLGFSGCYEDVVLFVTVMPFSADSSGCVWRMWEGLEESQVPLPVCLVIIPPASFSVLQLQRPGEWIGVEFMAEGIAITFLLLPPFPLGICRDVEAALAPAYRLSVYRFQYTHILATRFGCFPSRR